VKVLKRSLRRRSRDERGATFVLTAMSIVLLLWAGAAGVDIGFSVYGSRQAQAMADTAAMDLARYINYADTAYSSVAGVQAYLNTKLAQVLTDNGSGAKLSVVPGYYNTSTGKFAPDGVTGNSCQTVIAPPIPHPGCNAVEVTANQTVPQVFAGGFNTLAGHGSNIVSGSVSGTSIATQNPLAGYSIGTYLANLNNPQAAVLNPLLSQLGVPSPPSVNLTAVGYQGLVTANVTIGQLINASGGLLSASNVMTTQLTAGQWLSIYDSAVGSDYGTGSTAYQSLQALGTFSQSSSTDVELCQMVNVQVSASTKYNCTNGSQISQQGLDATVNVLQMLTTEAEVANGTNGLDLTSALNLNSALAGVPGLSVGNVMLSTTVISPADVVYGPVGTPASDAQVQATLSMNLTLLGVPLGTLSIPLSAATGTAVLSTLKCNSDQLSQMVVSPVNTNAVSASVTLTLLGVQSTEGTFSMAGVSNGTTSFSGPGLPPATVPPTAATASAGTNPETVGSHTPTFSWSAAAGVNADASATMGVLQTVYGPDLQALGITVGGADIEALSANCGTVSLVQ
jgi:tight adherence protein G